MSAALDIPDIARDERLRGRTAIVTGAGSAGPMGGSGSDVAILLAAKGARVVVLDISRERADHTREGIERIGGTCLVHVCDITRAGRCGDAVRAALDAFGTVDILVNNAAIAPGEQDNTEELWDRILALNLKAAKLMSDATVPWMRRQGGGSIVHISSIAGLRAGGGIAYSAAKGGMIAMARAQAHEYGRHGIRVNTVAPGHVAIPMGLNFQGWEGGGTDAIRLKRAQASLLGTEGTGWDIAYAVAFLAGDEARYITGHTLPVDGGATEVMPIVMAARIEGAA